MRPPTAWAGEDLVIPVTITMIDGSVLHADIILYPPCRGMDQEAIELLMPGAVVKAVTDNQRGSG